VESKGLISTTVIGSSSYRTEHLAPPRSKKVQTERCNEKIAYFAKVCPLS
jgi:hypothetical protein